MNEQDKNSFSDKLSIVLHCWDQYSDVRDIFFKTFEMWWKKCPYDFVVSCNAEIIDKKSYCRYVTCSQNSNTVERVLAALKATDSKYILIIHEDAIFMNEPDIDNVNEIVKYMENNNIVFTKLASAPNRQGKTINKKLKLKLINKRQPYGLNFLCAIYERSYLLSILGDGSFDTWHIEKSFLNEVYSSSRGYFNDKLICVSNPLRVYFGVDKGSWDRKAIKKLNRLHLQINPVRKVKTRKEQFKKDLYDALSTMVLPLKFRSGLKKVLTKLGFKFTTDY